MSYKFVGQPFLTATGTNPMRQFKHLMVNGLELVIERLLMKRDLSTSMVDLKNLLFVAERILVAVQ